VSIGYELAISKSNHAGGLTVRFSVPKYKKKGVKLIV
jgi:hypothetical protein